jgi:hypothetical protein
LPLLSPPRHCHCPRHHPPPSHSPLPLPSTISLHRLFSPSLAFAPRASPLHRSPFFSPPRSLSLLPRSFSLSSTWGLLAPAPAASTPHGHGTACYNRATGYVVNNTSPFLSSGAPEGRCRTQIPVPTYLCQ